jgi:hypothetical protein
MSQVHGASTTPHSKEKKGTQAWSNQQLHGFQSTGSIQHPNKAGKHPKSGVRPSLNNKPANDHLALPSNPSVTASPAASPAKLTRIFSPSGARTGTQRLQPLSVGLDTVRPREERTPEEPKSLSPTTHQKPPPTQPMGLRAKQAAAASQSPLLTPQSFTNWAQPTLPTHHWASPLQTGRRTPPSHNRVLAQGE